MKEAEVPTAELRVGANLSDSWVNHVPHRFLSGNAPKNCRTS